MTDEEFNQKVQEAVKNCMWRNDEFGVDICKGDLALCRHIIDRGKCDTLIRLFRDMEVEE